MINLSIMTTLLNTIIDTPCKGVQVSKLVDEANYEVLMIAMEKDAELPPHVANNDAHLIVLDGNIQFHINEEKIELGPQQLLNFSKQTTHWVKAIIDSKFLVIK